MKDIVYLEVKLCPTIAGTFNLLNSNDLVPKNASFASKWKQKATKVSCLIFYCKWLLQLLLHYNVVLLLIFLRFFLLRALGISPSSRPSQHRAEHEEQQIEPHQHQRLHHHATGREGVRDHHLLVVLLHDVLGLQNQHRPTSVQIRVQVSKPTHNSDNMSHK